MNILMLKISLNLGTGEMFLALIMFHGAKINIFQLIVVLAGLKELLAQLLIESISSEIEHGLISPFHHKLSLTAKPEEVVMVVTLEAYMLLLNQMVSLRKAAKIILLRILIISVALPSKNAWIALILKVKSQEIKETVGLLLNIPFGKLPNTVVSQELTT
jgi:hypothetical protein